MSPYKNADVSYQRCTMNAVPTTSSLLNKSKAPFSLVCTPYRTLKEGEVRFFPFPRFSLCSPELTRLRVSSPKCLW